MASGRSNPNSHVALYMRPAESIRGKSRPGFVSGYLVSDVTDPSQSWYFIEPLRPLLSKIFESREGSRAMSMEELQECLPASHNAHIVYDVTDQPYDDDTGFSLQLEPARWAKLSVTRLNVPFHTSIDTGDEASVDIDVEVSNLTREAATDEDPMQDDVELRVQQADPQNPDGPMVSVERQSKPIALGRNDIEDLQFSVDLTPGVYMISVRTDGNAMKRIARVAQGSGGLTVQLGRLNLVSVADPDFHRLYEGTVKDQLWWEGMMEVTNLVDAFYNVQLPGLEFSVRALESWASGSARPGAGIPDYDGDGEPDINAYTMLCHVAQGFIDGVPADSGANRVPTTSPGTPGLVHLFSGHDLGPLQDQNALSDAAGLCDQNCSNVGNDVIGLAEGLGGLRRPESRTCMTGSHAAPAAFEPAAQHSLSQQAPKVFQGDPNDLIPNKSFEATLYQRFILLAHEIGHSLGANHSPDPTTIMHTPLQNTIRFKLDADPKQQDNEAEIKACWLNC